MVGEHSKKTCDERYLLSNQQPYYKKDPDTMHLKCIDDCIATEKCKYCFVQNKQDGVKNGKCQLFSDCDVIVPTPNTKSGRTFAIVARIETTVPTTTMTRKTTTAIVQLATTTTLATTLSMTSATTTLKKIAPPGNAIR